MAAASESVHVPPASSKREQQPPAPSKREQQPSWNDGEEDDEEGIELVAPDAESSDEGSGAESETCHKLEEDEDDGSSSSSDEDNGDGGDDDTDLPPTNRTVAGSEKPGAKPGASEPPAKRQRKV